MRAWRVEYTFAAKAVLRELPWRSAARVDAAVQRFATSGEGDVEPAGDTRSARLRIGRYIVRVQIDPGERTMTVLYVFSEP